MQFESVIMRLTPGC